MIDLHSGSLFAVGFYTAVGQFGQTTFTRYKNSISTVSRSGNSRASQINSSFFLIGKRKDIYPECALAHSLNLQISTCHSPFNTLDASTMFPTGGDVSRT